MVTLRKADEKDLSAVNRLLRQVLTVHADARPDIFIPGRKKYSDAELVSIFKDGNTPVLVYALDGKVLGYAFCIKKEVKDHPILRDRRELYIDDLCVDERFRKRGIGKALYEEVLRMAKSEGFDAVTLNVWALNEGAMRFYEKCGFKPLKTVMEYELN